MSASDNLSTKCSGLLLRRSFAILAARTRDLISAALMPAFSVASRPSNSSDIAALISIPKHKSINGGPKKQVVVQKSRNLLTADRSSAFYWASYIGCPKNDIRAGSPRAGGSQSQKL